MCGLEVPDLEALGERLRRRGVAALGVATNTMRPEMTEARTRAFAERFGLKGPLALEPGDEVYRAYGALIRDLTWVPFPRQFLIDGEGRVVYASGRHDPAALWRAVERLGSPPSLQGSGRRRGSASSKGAGHGGS